MTELSGSTRVKAVRWTRPHTAALTLLVAAVACAAVWWWGPWNREVRYSRADLVSLNRIAERDPQDRLAWRQLGLRLAADGDAQLAEPALRQALALDTRDAEVATALGELLTARKDYSEAFQALQTAVNHRPDFLLARMALGRLYRKKGSYGHAAEQFTTVARSDPSFTDAHYELAICFLQLQQIAKAQGSISDALKQAPREPGYLAVQASIDAALGNIDRAAASLETAASLAPGDVKIQSNLAKMLLVSGRGGADLPRAEKAVARVADLDPDYPLLPFLRGQLAVERGDWSEAAVHLRQAIARTPDLNESYYALSRAERRLGHAREADRLLAAYRRRQSLLRRIDELRISLGNRPNQPDVYADLAALQIELEDRRGAAASLRAALEIKPESKALKQRLDSLIRTPPTGAIQR